MILFATLTACMVGPDFHKPKPPNVKAYNANPLTKKTASADHAGYAGRSQFLINGRDIPGEWWELFGSPEINKLIQAGIKNSPNLEAAKQALIQAHEAVNAQVGNLLYPAFDINLQGQRQNFAGATFGGGVTSSVFNLFGSNVSSSYTVDVFGGNRRTIQSLQAQADNKQFELMAAYLSLTANIVTTSIASASYRDQISTTKSLIKAQAKQLKIMQRQYRLGGIADTNVLAQKTLLEQTRATLPPLQKSLSQTQHSLAVLVGEYPDKKMPEIKLASLKLPVKIPVSLPSRLVQQRPDVRASEALLHSASAEIGVATAQMLPTFPITANFGWISSVPSGLFKAINKSWDYGMSIMQPAYHGGAISAFRRQTVAAYMQVLAQYKQVLLQAFQNTADSLRALETDARALKYTMSAEIASRNTLKITRKQYYVGGVSYLQFLNAQTQYQQTRLASIKAAAMRYADTAALFQSLGGGWWNNKDFKCNKELNPENASLTCP